MKKCCRCKMMVPPKIHECPFCGAKYTGFEYFRMNWLPAVVVGTVAVIVGINVIDIMVFNKKIRSAVTASQTDEGKIEELKSQYEKKNPLKKGFIRYSELSIMSDAENMRETTDGDSSVDVKIYSQSGSISGAYKGEMIDGMPDGIGEITYADNGGETTYEGEFSGGKIKGAGVMTLSNGWTLKGSFFEGELNGYGKKISPSGVTTERGEFVNNQLSGRGVKYAWDGNVIYDGDFTYGLPEKLKYIDVCTPVDITSGKYEGFVGKNIAVDGSVIDLVSDDTSGEEYFIMSCGDDGKVKFKVIDTGNSIQRKLLAQHKVYGYCESVGDIVDSTGAVIRGITVNAFYSDR